ncbi:Putative protein [Zobellia galactanivorans]|uniref:Uncharacterized protein n=1 Tax=Zobellia galactanivorans (strain DSM 12802 / CCUG 47099 / CIP 106680 / NCIMB 13871 / Dsij) TaxID=63186 RepID=G0L2D6_ZOBGA|nr:Putative protein [Zobellia galactanivorans]
MALFVFLYPSKNERPLSTKIRSFVGHNRGKIYFYYNL